MTDQRIERLLERRALERVAPTEEELLGYWEKAGRAYDDARLEDASAEGAFDRAYQAAFLLATAVVRAAGYRVRARGGGHHSNTFYTLGALGDAELERLAGGLNDLRSTRHDALYEAMVELPRAEVERMLHAAEGLRRLARFRLIAARPELADQLDGGPSA